VFGGEPANNDIGPVRAGVIDEKHLSQTPGAAAGSLLKLGKGRELLDQRDERLLTPIYGNDYRARVLGFDPISSEGPHAVQTNQVLPE
jgi:hypothetical protein